MLHDLFTIAVNGKRQGSWILLLPTVCLSVLPLWALAELWTSVYRKVWNISASWCSYQTLIFWSYMVMNIRNGQIFLFFISLHANLVILILILSCVNIFLGWEWHRLSKQWLVIHIYGYACQTMPGWLSIGH